MAESPITLLKPNDFIDQICAALGIDTSTVRGIDIHAEYHGSGVEVTVHHFANNKMQITKTELKEPPNP